MRPTLAKRLASSLSWGIVGLLASLLLATASGVEHVDLRRAFSDPASLDATIFCTRLSRVLLGAFVGAALAPSGLAFQALLRNPLADPYVLGVSGGAALFGAIAIVFGLSSTLLGTLALPLFAFVGAIVAIALVFRLGQVRGRLVPNVALLVGVILNALSSALVLAIRLIASPNAAHEALYWLTGTLGPIETSRLVMLGGYVVVGIGMLWMKAVPMNAFAGGELAALAVGVDVERSRRFIFIGASLLTGAAVAFSGPIGFVGVVVPHVLRGLIGADHRLLVPTCALWGAAFVVLADWLARLSFLWIGTEPTVGVLTALCGAPFFLWVLRTRGPDRVFG